MWEDVCALLKDPERVALEHRRRLEGGDRRETSGEPRRWRQLIRKVRRGIARLIDAYGEGLLEKEEFEPRIRAARERLARLQAEARERADADAEERELRLVIGQFGDFAERVGSGLQEADWATRRGIVRGPGQSCGGGRGGGPDRLPGESGALLLRAPRGAFCKVVVGVFSSFLACRSAS